jgi:hypothetical protein
MEIQNIGVTMNRILEFFQEDNGGLSATRLAFLYWALGVLIVWIVESLASKPMVIAKIDSNVTTILGILMTGKVVQKFGEKPEAPQEPATNPLLSAGSSGAPTRSAASATPSKRLNLDEIP